MSDSTALSESRPPRRTRSASESLLSIALGLESFLVFFVALTAFGVRALEPLPAFLGGAGLVVALLVVGRQLRHRWGVWLGWVLQGVLLATGILLPIMYAIAAGFVGIWIYCFVTGRRLDRAKAAFEATRFEATRFEATRSEATSSETTRRDTPPEETA